MAARTTWQAAATAAAGEVTERSGVCVSSAVFVLVRHDIADVRCRSGLIGGVFVGMDDEFVFTMDTPVDRFFFNRTI